MSYIYDKVYPFTNENLRALSNIYNFDGANVLTVAGSGDQFFTSILNGAKNVDIFDINSTTWYYFVLKYVAMKLLNYEEFYNYFVVNRTNDKKIYAKIREFLPSDVKWYFDNLLSKGKDFSSIWLASTIYSGPKNLGDGSVIPYFDIDNYYKLQEILQRSKLPNFFSSDLLELQEKLKVKYDLMLFSNIYLFTNQTAQEYVRFLEGFDTPLIQAHYTWNVQKRDISDLISEGLIPTYVPSVLNTEEEVQDVVLTYERKR